jgi:hypothetical protein
LQLCISSKTLDIATLVLKRSLTIENMSRENDCRSINELSLIETLKIPKRKTAGVEKMQPSKISAKPQVNHEFFLVSRYNSSMID